MTQHLPGDFVRYVQQRSRRGHVVTEAHERDSDNYHHVIGSQKKTAPEGAVLKRATNVAFYDVRPVIFTAPEVL